MNRSEYLLYRPDAPRRSIGKLWFATFAIFAVLYGLTCARGYAWQDSGIFQLRILTGDLRGWMGLALAHPLLIVVGHPFTWFPEAMIPWGLNAVSGLAAAVAVANLACVVDRLTGKRWIALAAAGMLGVSHTFWWLATITENYTLQAALFTAELWLLIRLWDRPSGKRLAALALVSGLGFSAHNLALLAIPVYLVAVVALVGRRKLRFRAVLRAGCVWMLGAGLMLGLIAEQAWSSGDVFGTIRDALVGGYADDVLNVGAKHNPRAMINAGLLGMNLVSFVVPLALIGWWNFARRLGGPLAAVLGAITLVDIVFVVRYPVPDQFMFCLPALVMLTIGAAVGAATLMTWNRKWKRLAVLACMLSILIPPIAQVTGAYVLRDTPFNRTRRPFRSEVRYWLIPWKHNEHSATEFSRAAFAQAGPDGIVFADSTSYFPLVLNGMFTPDDITVIYGKHIAGDSEVVDGPIAAHDPEAFLAANGDRTLWTVNPEAVPEALKPMTTVAPKNAPADVLDPVIPRN